MSVAKLLVDELKKRNYTISFAESCTGGMMASTLVDVSGASSVFEYGFITYSADSKISVLGVSEDTIKEHGVVSIETAKEMAEGARQKSNSNVAVSVTGCAGPGKDNDGNEQGTICFGFSINGNIISEKIHIDGKTRNDIRYAAVEYAFKRVYFLLSKESEPTNQSN
jgi:PncC family amidohydrolase